MEKQCIWCFATEFEASFLKKAHTIPRSLGGQHYNKLVCDSCNEYFGATHPRLDYSIESALKETFCISRQRFLNGAPTKRNIGQFRSKFFDIKERRGRPRLVVKPAFKLNAGFLKTICRNFKRGLIKMWFEDYHRQQGNQQAHDFKYQALRDFARYNLGDIHVFYFERSFGVFMMGEREAETPVLLLNRMLYLYEDEKFTEIEFLGHVFGFATTTVTDMEIQEYLERSVPLKREHFKSYISIDKLTDIDFTLSILDRR